MNRPHFRRIPTPAVPVTEVEALCQIARALDRLTDVVSAVHVTLLALDEQLPQAADATQEREYVQ